MTCPLCMLGHANHLCDNNNKVSKDSSEEDGTVSFYGKWFTLYDPYIYSDKESFVDIQWDGATVGYDGLKQETYDRGQAVMKWAQKKYGHLFGDNVAILPDELAIEIITDMHKEFYMRGDKSLDKVCQTCNKPIEKVREVYVIPTCYSCLPPPDPLPIKRLKDV
jgi:hypothetical protein